MKTILTALLCAVCSYGIAQTDSIIYPVAPQSDTHDTLWGVDIADRYRPLEINDAARKEWISQEKAITAAYFKKTKSKMSIEVEFEHISSYNTNIPSRQGPYYIQYYLHGNVVNMFYKTSLKDDEPKLLISPTVVNDRLLSFTNTAISKDGQYLAFTYSLDGSDWNELGVYEIQGEKVLKDHISNVRYSDIDWRGDGFYYSRFDSVDEHGRLTDVQRNQKLYYHKVGNRSSQDSLVYENPSQPLNLFDVKVTSDERFVIISEEDRDEIKVHVHFKDYTTNTGFVKIDIPTGFRFSVIDSKGDQLLARTTYPDAYNGRIVRLDTKAPSKWAQLVPNQKEFAIKQAMYSDDKFIMVYQHGFQQTLAILTDSGKVIKVINRPTGSNTSLASYSPEERAVVLAKSYYFCPPIGEKLNLSNDSISIISKTRVSFDPQKYKIITTEYVAQDSTRIPIYIVYSKAFEKKGPKPTLLDVYGGFGISEQAHFDPGLVLFLSSGGVYAYANVRGGANSVKNWHYMGRLLNKHNTFSDTYDAVRYLISTGLADSTRVALTGGSNGGMVCGAVVNQHPEAFRAVIPVVGVYDMIRAERFTVGAYHTKMEFGTVTDSVQFRNLLSYSPLHNIKSNTAYPSILVMTSDNDDRVPPLHSYKYLATLQAMTHSPNPMLMQEERNAGHHGASSFDRRVARSAYFYGFLFRELGMKFQSAGFF